MTANRLVFLVLIVSLLSCSRQAKHIPVQPGQNFDSVIKTSTHRKLPNSYINEKEGFPLSIDGNSSPILISGQDHAGIERVARLFQTDIGRVTGKQPALSLDSIPAVQSLIIAGSLKSPLIRQLIEAGKLQADDLEGKWEKFIIQTVSNPFNSVKEALVIAGSDKRGTIYGMFDISKKMGVSPWYWWADVPIVQRSKLFITPGKYTLGEPKVKYRGIFINDEAPALSGWAHEKFGGFNYEFYDKVFELILRLKGNYLWPAMWGRAIYDDDPQSPELADEYGVVIGTSHHEPLMRAHVEWERYGEGPWNYGENEERLREFWRKGIERMGDNESIISIGMRGDGDEPMTEETAIGLLERIVRDQREIIANVTGKPASETPQLWALYKEVQDYYDKGMRVPDDVTLLLCDDNWGNIRKLPARGDTFRSGGYGIYYHYDYVGGPRNYKWVNTNQISRVWEQMHLAYEYGAREIWIVNVGDIKPMEFPISFFLDYAWNSTALPASEIVQYGEQWAASMFGNELAEPIAEILHKYSMFNSRIKPELLSPETYSLINFREFETVVGAYNELLSQAEEVNQSLAEEYKSTFFQLVFYPVAASANLNELYYTVAKNRWYAEQGRSLTNDLAEEAKAMFEKDQQLSDRYHGIGSGKWNHMMSQTHIGYTYWQQPEEQVMPETEKINLPEESEMGVSIEGSREWWPESESDAVLPVFDSENDQEYYIEVFNRGMEPFHFDLSSLDSFIEFSEKSGTIDSQNRIYVSINWDEIAPGKFESAFSVQGSNETVTVSLKLVKSEKEMNGRFPNDGFISFEASDYVKAIGNDPAGWLEIPQLGRTKSGMTPVPVTSPPMKPLQNDGLRLEYQVFLPDSGDVRVRAYFSPTLNFHNDEGLKFAISFDDQKPQRINLHEDFNWATAVSNNCIIKTSAHSLTSGSHTLKFWAVDPGVVLQKLVVITGHEKESCLGAPSQ